DSSSPLRFFRMMSTVRIELQVKKKAIASAHTPGIRSLEFCALSDSFQPITDDSRRSPRRSALLAPVKAAHFLPQALARQGLFDPLFFAGFQIVGMFLDILDNVFLLNLALETAKGAF